VPVPWNYNVSMDVDKWFVTLGGECFEAEFEGEVSFRLTGIEHRFKLHDVRRGRGDRLVILFRSDNTQPLPPNYNANIGVVRINIIRRAFDSGKLSFDAPSSDQKYEPVEMKDSDFNQHPLASDEEIRRYIKHKAFWLSYMHPSHPGLYPVSFDTPEDLDYLGATQTEIRRSVVRLFNQGMLDKVMDRIGRPTEQLISDYESTQNSRSDGSGGTLRDMHDSPPATHQGLSIFISHSSKDVDLALALIDLLKAGLGLTADRIRCSSVDGYRLPVGVNTESKLREEVNAAKVVVGLITRSSLSSAYVMFELGARWGANLFLAPLLAGVKGGELSGPLSLLNALSASNEAQLHQLLEDIANHLGLRVQPPASYIRNVAAVKGLADALANSATPAPVATTAVKQKLRLGVSVEGNPPSQLLRVVANRPVEVSRVEYMLSSEATIDAEDVSKQGDKIDIPINDGSVLKVWNTPRADRNHSDHSGPAKIALIVSDDAETNQYILPVQMQSGMQGNTTVRKLVGSKTFFGS
jgi:hypothetical protein